MTSRISSEYPEPTKYDGHSGYVYLLTASVGIHKIGQTNNPERRFKRFKSRLPFDFVYEYLILTNNTNQLEQELHSKFKNRQFCHEWFALQPEDVEYIKRLADRGVYYGQ